MSKKARLKLVLILVAIALILVTGIQNSGRVELKFLFWTFESRLWVLVMVTALIGMFTGVLVSLLDSSRGADRKSGGREKRGDRGQ
jgi:uncharacterized integral membrane protein